MPKISTITFSGRSSAYTFEVYSLDTTFNPVGAVYIFSKREIGPGGTGTHTPVYIGETGSLQERFSNHEKWQRILSCGANAVCVHVDPDSTSRLRKETDLRQMNETPCNDQ